MHKESLNLTQNHVPENDGKLITVLQFAHKANKLAFGHDAVIRAISKKKARLILTATDLSENSYISIKRTIEEILTPKTEIIKWGNKEKYYEIFGKQIGIVAILNENFQKGFKKHLSFIQSEE